MVDAVKFLLENAKGDAFVAVNLGTLGLKSRVSDALTPDGSEGMSLLKDSLGYESTVNTSPVSLLGISNQLNELHQSLCPAMRTDVPFWKQGMPPLPFSNLC